MRSTITLKRSAQVMLGLAVGLSVGCLTSRPDPDHCLYRDGDVTCAELHPGELTFCSTCQFTPSGDGCVAELPDDACYSPCGAGRWFDDDTSCLDGLSSSSGEESTSTGQDTGTEGSSGSGESSTTGPMPCEVDEDCLGDAAPFCEPVSGECVACDAFGAEGDAACAGLDPAMPLCVGGACVACTPENPIVCNDQLLLCDGGTNACVTCTEHTQCGSGACELDVGRCFPEDFVVTVDGDGPADYTTIAAAVGAVEDGTHGVIVVHELDMQAPYVASVTIDGSKTIALLAASGEAPVILGTGGNPGLRVEGAGTVVYMDGMRLAGNTGGLGLVLNEAFAWADRSRIVQNSGGGVLVEVGAELVLRNCFVGGAIDTDVLAVQGATADVLYTTLGASLGTSTALTCDAGSTVSIRNGLVVSRDAAPEVVCTNLTASNTAAEMTLAGMGNVALGDMSTTWFQDYNAGDLHLVAGAPLTIGNSARWEDGDPLTDIDGDARPELDGAPDFAGADVP